jgi:plasmid stabilization system protein ParE
MNIRLLEPAQAELDEAITWYAAQAPGLGDAFLIETLKTIKLIKQFPEAWHPLTPLSRRCRLKRFPYSVVYTLDGDEILVLSVAHQHRKTNYWRSRLG